MANIRIGYGVDFHQLVEGRDLWIGGVKIPHTKGALGHSDADVLLHAICDAMLGAACLGDIGQHFPDTSNEFKNIDSKILLQKSFELIKNKGYSIVNIDTTHASFSFAPIKVESLDVVDASTTRTNLGLVIGTNVQAPLTAGSILSPLSCNSFINLGSAQSAIINESLANVLLSSYTCEVVKCV
jgi:hypothetical protein